MAVSGPSQVGHSFESQRLSTVILGEHFKIYSD
jgi:hypothetical protein